MGVLAVEVIRLMQRTLDRERTMFELAVVVHELGPDLDEVVNVGRGRGMIGEVTGWGGSLRERSTWERVWREI